MTAWRTLKASVRDAAHIRAGLPNQDAVRVARYRDDLPLITALADGHGSAKSFRSQRIELYPLPATRRWRPPDRFLTQQCRTPDSQRSPVDRQ